MTANSTVKVTEKCRVGPPPEDDDAVAELTLPLTFYDIQWLALPPVHQLHFYRFLNPNPNHIPNIISSIKSSLSLVLKHFLPLAGNLISPRYLHPDYDHKMPELYYKKGDSVSLTIAESNMDFDYLVGDHQKGFHLFCDLLPQLHDPTFLASSQVSPLLALQVTVFPNSGISIGRTLHHVVGDASTFINFSESWASINKFKFIGDSLKQFHATCSYDRSVVQDPFDLGSKILSDIILFKQQRSCVKLTNPIIYKDEVHATFILHKCDIMKLKRFVAAKQTSGSVSGSNTKNVWSTFTLASALVWSCLSKSLDYVKEEDVELGDDKQEYLLAYINCRQRYDTQIPQNYFGNCIVPCIVRSTHGQLAGDKGFLVAATTIRDAIQKRLHDKEGFLRGDWLADTYTQTKAVAPGMLEIDGATQHNVYNDNNADFDWGELVKQQGISINSSEFVLEINLSRRYEGARELSIALPKKRMDAFTAILTDCIRGADPGIGSDQC